MSRLGSYFVERFPVPLFGTAIVLLAATVLWIGGAVSVDEAGFALLLASLLIVKYRLWDDLEDVEADRATHPDRVLVSGSLLPFRLLLVALTIAAVVACLADVRAFTILLALDCVFLAAYRRLRATLPDHAWRYGVLLLKYPAILAIASYATVTVIPERLAIGAIAAYALSSAYERWHHDPLQAGASS